LIVARVFTLNDLEPYRSVPRERQTSALHEIFPRFGRAFSGPTVAARMSELKVLLEEHALHPGRDFTVVPSFPLAHFLTFRQTRAPMDWYVRFDLFGLEREVLGRLREFDGVILLERDASQQPCSREDFASAPRRFNRRIFEYSRLLATSRYFCVVEPIRE
jgi:hypothetical protein